MGRKPHSTAKLHNLPLEQQQDLCDWFIAGMSYRAAKVAVLKEFKVATSLGALHDYYHSFCVPELARQRLTARDTAAEVAGEAKASPGQWSEAALEKLEQYAFEMMLNPGADPKDVKSVFSMIFKRQSNDLAREKIEVERDKLSAASKSKVEAGLDALLAEIKHIPEALAAFEIIKQEVAKG